MKLIGHKLIDPGFPRGGGSFLVGIPLMKAAFRGEDGDAARGVAATSEAEHARLVVVGVLNFSD